MAYQAQGMDRCPIETAENSFPSVSFLCSIELKYCIAPFQKVLFDTVFTLSLILANSPCLLSTKVEYGVISPTFICAPVYSCGYSLTETPQLPPPPAFGLIYEGAIGQPRKTTSLCNPLAFNHGYLIRTAHSRRTKRTSINRTKKDPYSLLGDPHQNGADPQQWITTYVPGSNSSTQVSYS
jgi:hypothetical protein